MPTPKKKNTGSLYTAPLVMPEAEKPSAEKEPVSREETPLWRELRVLVAAKLYGSERLSSERAAKLAGINHVEFLLSLGFYKVFPLQAELNELEQPREQ
jgi:predicted HTH domain antitoxin